MYTTDRKTPLAKNLIKLIVNIPDDLKGHVIGRKGSKIKEIQRETGARMKIIQQGALIEGDDNQIKRAEDWIHSIIERQQLTTKTVSFPASSFSSVLGENGATIQSIKRQTSTEIWIEKDDQTAHAQVSYTKERDFAAAEKMILKVVSNSSEQHSRPRHKPKKYAFVDGSCVEDDADLHLEVVPDQQFKGNQMYKLIMDNDGMSPQATEVGYIAKLKSSLLEVLRAIRKESQDSDNSLRTDMWCHFGHAYIHSVDEAEAEEYFNVNDISNNLQLDENKWETFFQEGLERAEYDDLEQGLADRPYKVDPNVRFDYQFRSPTGRTIRFKAFAFLSDSYPDGIQFQRSVIPMKNVMATCSNATIQYYLCAPSTVRLKVDILFPHLKFDCHIVVRTTLKETTTVQHQEEDRILTDFLDDNLKLENGKIELPEELPPGYSLTYRRYSKRRQYPYTSSNDVDFNVTISEEETQQLPNGNECNRTDIHLHCDEWDDLLDQEDWEPEAVVSKLPDFLNFLKEVQENVRPGNTE